MLFSAYITCTKKGDKTMKKLIALCLTIMLVLVAVPVIGATAADSGEFVVSTTEAGRGETVNVTVSIKNNPGIVSAKVKVAYDADVLELTDKAEGAFAGVAYGPTTNNPFVVNWVDSIHPNNTTNGALVTLTFKVKDGAAFGQSPITLTFDPDDVFDSNDANVTFTSTNGSINVVCVHDGGKADCSNKAICDICGEPYGEFGDHAYTEKVDDKYLKSAATCTSKAVYYKSCSVCGTAGTETFENGEVLPHAYIEKVDAKYLKSAATCVTKAVYYKSCSVCGEKGTETFENGEVDTNNHVGETEVIDKVDPTCTEKGYTGDTICKDCKKVLTEGSVIDALGHNVAKWTTTKEATTEESGIKEGECTVCKEKIVIETGKKVTEIKNENATVEAVGDTVLDESTVLVTENVSEKLDNSEKADMQKKVEELKFSVENIKLAEIFDISLFLRNDTIQDSEIEPEGTIRVTIEIPANLFENFNNVKLLHFLDDGSVEEVVYTLNGTKATFETNSLSYFAFVGTPVEENNNNNNNNNNSNSSNNNKTEDKGTTENTNNKETSPATASDINMILASSIAVIALAALCVTTVIYKKRKVR